ncbi:MAG: tRNA pseudouridine(38-40) synthase TruA [Clostridia bacterium]|nr:tRNA pseudouridine(38-40) synthase TruA [Clostridia bacterium]
MNYYTVIAYDGTHFNGWQAQRGENKNLRTVQETVEAVAEEIFKKRTVITASGRTDAGVHARGQVCSFTAETTIPPERIADCFNAKLPKDVKFLESGAAEENFDACRSAKEKTYVYSLYLSDRENPLLERYHVRVQGNLNVEKKREAAGVLEGEHDFKAFCAANSTAKTTVRTVYEIRIEEEKDAFQNCVLRIYVTGNGFLYNMVRTLAGTLLDVGFSRRGIADIERALKQGDRESVGKTMPAKGLCLLSVRYR